MHEKQPKPNVKRTIARSTNNGQGKTDWRRVDALGDKDIRAAIRKDTDAAPELHAAWFRQAKIVLPEPKKAVSIRLDRDIMKWFQRQGKGYQTRINAVLRAYVEAQRQ